MILDLYLDMDGVLCNFDKAYRKITDIRVKDHKQFRDAVMNYKIFEDLEFMPDTQELLNYVAKIDGVNIQILTSMGTFDKPQANEAMRQKQKWLDKHNIPYPANFVHSKEEKSMYATPTSILIDDSVGCIKPFEYEGGYGILHTSAKESIKHLEYIMTQIRAMHAVRFV
jgi:hypothetical protein